MKTTIKTFNHEVKLNESETGALLLALDMFEESYSQTYTGKVVSKVKDSIQSGIADYKQETV